MLHNQCFKCWSSSVTGPRADEYGWMYVMPVHPVPIRMPEQVQLEGSGELREREDEEVATHSRKRKRKK